VLQAPPPKAGSVRLEGRELVGLRGRSLLDARRSVQMVFQDPYGSLDPRWRVSDIVEEPLDAYGIGTRAARRQRVREVLDRVGLDPDAHGRRRPRRLSGGQAQRVAIARALALDPALIICDEAVSSLDVLIQAQVLNLFEQLRADLGLSYLFIAHDLALVKQVSDRVAVMYLGKLVEIGPGGGALPRAAASLHGRAAGLDPEPGSGVAAQQVPTRRSAATSPSPIDPPSGCRFRTRCPRAQDLCAREEPPLRELGERPRGRCHFPVETGTPASHGSTSPNWTSSP
jgi:oligopeptide transport system ATP-binding protein